MNSVPAILCAFLSVRQTYARIKPELHSLRSCKVPREIQHVSYSTAQMSHDLNILHSKMAHSKSSGKLIAELPAVHALTAQLKEAKNGTTEARHLHDKIKVHLHSIGSQLLEGKVEHANMAHAVKCNADAIHSRSKYIGKL